MKKNYFFTLLLTLIFNSIGFGQDLVITGVIDGPLPGGSPKGFELYAVNNISDLSIYGLESTTNGATASGVEYTFPSDQITAGTFIYVGNTNSTAGFQQYLGVTPQYENGVASINGDDTVILYKNGVIEDLVGRIGEDGSNTDWDHLDGWIYRKNGKGPSDSFEPNDWTRSGANALDGCDKSDDTGTNAECSSVFPVGTYSATASTEPALAITSPTADQVFPSTTTEVNVTLSIDNFTVSGDAGGGVSDNSGDGYLKTTIQETGQADVIANLFTSTLTPINVVAGRSYTATVELVDNSGNSLSPRVEASVSFEVIFPCEIQLTTIDTTCDAETSGADSFTTTIDFTGGNTGIAYTITAKDSSDNDVGTIGGDNPDSVAAGQIIISGVPEGTDFTVKVVGGTGSSCDLTRSINSPTCVSVSCPAVGSIIITEIMQNPSSVSDSNGEYFEVYNTTGVAIDLLGWILKDSSSTSETHTVSSSIVVPANGYAVLGVNTDMATNGGVTVNYDYGSSYYLGNGTDDIVLECGGTTIDAVEWDNGATFPDPNGKSMELATNKYDVTDNDSGANWAEATAEITTGGDLGTPGTANSFVLSIQRNEIEGFATYPNPVTNNEFTVTTASSDAKQVAIYNVIGKQVFTSNFTGTRSTINIASLAKGLYILKVTEGTKVATSKLIIK